MRRRVVHLATLCLSAFALLCWGVMFLAGTDVWHAAGRPDFWTLQGPPYQDLRAFAYAFYLLLVALTAHTVVTALDLITGWRRT